MWRKRRHIRKSMCVCLYVRIENCVYGVCGKRVSYVYIYLEDFVGPAAGSTLNAALNSVIDGL